MFLNLNDIVMGFFQVLSKADKALNYVAPQLANWKVGEKLSRQALPLTDSGKIRVCPFPMNKCRDDIDCNFRSGLFHRIFVIILSVCFLPFCNGGIVDRCCMQVSLCAVSFNSFLVKELSCMPFSLDKFVALSLFASASPFFHLVAFMLFMLLIHITH